jgi:hypothetical protein
MPIKMLSKEAGKELCPNIPNAIPAPSEKRQAEDALKASSPSPQPGAPALSEYIIIEKLPHGISAWFCELPTTLFSDYCNQGASVAGPMSFVLEDVQKRCAEWHDSVSTDSTPSDMPSIAEFYDKYEDCWDYIHQTAEGGGLWEQYITEVYPQTNSAWRMRFFMLEDLNPKHMSDIPDPVRSDYRQFLQEVVAEMYDVPVDELEYTDEQAFEDYAESLKEDRTCY